MNDVKEVKLYSCGYDAARIIEAALQDAGIVYYRRSSGAGDYLGGTYGYGVRTVDFFVSRRDEVTAGEIVENLRAVWNSGFDAALLEREAMLCDAESAKDDTDNGNDDGAHGAR